MIIRLSLSLLLGLHLSWASLDTCASSNTGESNTQSDSLFMSNGLCTEQCRSKNKALAVVQGKSCWCSDTFPGSTTAVNKCDTPCPGFNSEFCGSTQQGLFGYIILKTPSTTQQASSSPASSSSSSSSQSSSSSSEPSSSSSSSSPSPTNNDDSEKKSQESQETTHPATSSPTTHEVVPSIVVSVVTILESGRMTTIANPEATAHSSGSAPRASGSGSASSNPRLANSDNSQSNGFFESKGKVAGVFTVVGLVGASLVALLIYFIYRRRSQSDDFDRPDSAASYTKDSNMAQLLRRDPSTLTGGANHTPGGSTGLAGSLVYDESSPPRYGNLIDQRLDPGQVFMQWDDTQSRRSLEDGTDYSRKILRVTNPED